jgi:3-oxoadipate enol-lactonase
MKSPVDCAYSDIGSGPSIVFIHGIGARRSLWQPLIDQLRASYRCVSYDLRGHGDSPLPDESFTLDDLVDDLDALVTKLGINTTHLVGHSLGGMIGPRYALRHAHKVRSVSLLSTAAFRTDDDTARVCGVVAKMRSDGIDANLDVLADRWFTDEFKAQHPERVIARKQQVTETDANVFLNVFDIYARTEMSSWLHDVRTPSLVLTGEFDGGCPPRLNEQIAKALSDREFVVMPALKHAILIEAPSAVGDVVQKFIARVERALRISKCCTPMDTKEA